MPRPVARLACGLTFAVILAGCGFRLQGAVTLPEGIDRVQVVATDELTPFATELRSRLRASGRLLADSTAQPDAVIRVRVDRTGRRVLSVSARNTPQEFEIFYIVEYSVERAGKEVVPPQRLELTRNFSFDQSLLLAKDREEDVLREAMARDLADLVLRRLASL